MFVRFCCRCSFCYFNCNLFCNFQLLWENICLFSDFEKTLVFILSDYDIIGSGICLSSFISFLMLECLVSLKYLHNIYIDQYLLPACDCVTALVLNS